MWMWLFATARWSGNLVTRAHLTFVSGSRSPLSALRHRFFPTLPPPPPFSVYYPFPMHLLCTYQSVCVCVCVPCCIIPTLFFFYSSSVFFPFFFNKCNSSHSLGQRSSIWLQHLSFLFLFFSKLEIGYLKRLIVCKKDCGGLSYRLLDCSRASRARRERIGEGCDRRRRRRWWGKERRSAIKHVVNPTAALFYFIQFFFTRRRDRRAAGIWNRVALRDSSQCWMKRSRGGLLRAVGGWAGGISVARDGRHTAHKQVAAVCYRCALLRIVVYRSPVYLPSKCISKI